MKSEVSVIIPFRENRGWLLAAVNSVPGWVELILSQGDCDVSENCNNGLKRASGKYIKFLHDDDILTPNSIEKSVEAIETLGVDFIHGKAHTIDEQGKLIRNHIPPKNITYADLLKRNSIHGGTVMYKREIFDKIGGLNENIHFSEEYEFNLRCLQAGFKLGYCDEFLAYYRKHEKAKTKNFKGNLSIDAARIAKEHIEYFKNKEV